MGILFAGGHMESVRRLMRGRSGSRGSSSSPSQPEAQRLGDDSSQHDDYVLETDESSQGTQLELAGSRLVVSIFMKSLRPASTSRSFYPIFQKKMHPTGYSWKDVPQSLIDEYFDEFKKEYTVPAEEEATIKKVWTDLAKVRYRDLVSKVIKKNKDTRKPPFIKEEDWPGWLAYWEREEVRQKAATNLRNRMTEVAGPGTGPAKHAGGSKSTVSYIEEKMKETGGVKPPMWEINRKYHMKANGEWVAEEFRRIDEAVMPRIEEAGGDEPLSKEEADRIYMDVVGVKKQRIRGMSSYGSSLASDARNFSSRSSSSSYGVNVEEIVTQRMQAERELLAAQVEERLAAERERVDAERAAERAAVAAERAADRERLAAERAADREALSQQLAAQMKEFMMTMSQQQPPQPPPP